MKKIALLLSSCLFLGCQTSQKTKKDTIAKVQSIYEFTMDDIKGNKVPLSDYQGKVLLIVNTASKCGFTPQFEGLEALYEEYKDQGFVVLGFPSNQFLHQDPGSNEEIATFCQANYGVSFPMFAKIDVNGEHAAPLYEYLKSNVPNEKYKKIGWNFTKFLIGKDGKPLKRYKSKIKPKEIATDIEQLLHS